MRYHTRLLLRWIFEWFLKKNVCNISEKDVQAMKRDFLNVFSQVINEEDQV